MGSWVAKHGGCNIIIVTTSPPIQQNYYPLHYSIYRTSTQRRILYYRILCVYNRSCPDHVVSIILPLSFHHQYVHFTCTTLHTYSLPPRAYRRFTRPFLRRPPTMSLRNLTTILLLLLLILLLLQYTTTKICHEHKYSQNG